MKGVRTSHISGWDNFRQVTLHMNLDILQWNNEPWGDGCYWITAEFHFVHRGMLIFSNSRRVQVDQWKCLKEVVMDDFVETMYEKLNIDFMPKQEVIDIVDRMFKNNDDHSTPLTLAAEAGLYHTVH